MHLDKIAITPTLMPLFMVEVGWNQDVIHDIYIYIYIYIYIDYNSTVTKNKSKSKVQNHWRTSKYKNISPKIMLLLGLKKCFQ